MQLVQERTSVREEFERARQEAVELTDRFNEQALADGPERAALWDRVVRQTELARELLQSWLAEDPTG